MKMITVNMHSYINVPDCDWDRIACSGFFSCNCYHPLFLFDKLQYRAADFQG